MATILDTVLLLALPASGKSEVRRYLSELSPKDCKESFHMGPTVQLDDFPYVHIMRRIDDELMKLNKTRLFFAASDKPFMNPLDWGTLIELVNEDYDDLVERRHIRTDSAARQLFDRLDAASAKVGAPIRLSSLDESTLKSIQEVLEEEAQGLLDDKNANIPDTLEGKTLVIEFARGGADGSSLPLPEPFGYAYSVGRLSKRILDKAVVLYIWVTPEESRRKNAERTNPDDPGSILHHGVPIDVLLNDYGCDDMSWLEEQSKISGTIPIAAHGETFHLPVARFDNRVDKTSFIRNDRADWEPEQVKDVHEGLQGALRQLANFRLA